MIKISKNGTEYIFNSVTGAARELRSQELGYESPPLNRESAFRYLEKQGFDLATLKEEKTTRTTTRKRPKFSIVEQVVKMCQVVDTEKINEVQNEINQAIATMTTAEDVKHIKALGEKLQQLKNPTATRADIVKKFEELLDEYYEAQQAEEENEPAEVQG